MRSGLKLTNNKIKDIKVIRFLENGGILLEVTTRKIAIQKGGFFSFLGH